MDTLALTGNLVALLDLTTATSIGLGLLLLLQEEQSVDLILESVLRGNSLLDLLTADQGSNDGGADNEGQHEAVHAVPVRGPTNSGGASVVVVKVGEGEELGDQSILNGEQQSGPGHSGGDHTGGITAVAELAAVASPLKTPVDSTEEREDLTKLGH